MQGDKSSQLTGRVELCPSSSFSEARLDRRCLDALSALIDLMLITLILIFRACVRLMRICSLLVRRCLVLFCFCCFVCFCYVFVLVGCDFVGIIVVLSVCLFRLSVFVVVCLFHSSLS